MLTREMRSLLHTLVERQMALPTLLFITGHKPLAFVLGQSMHLLAPLVSLLDGSPSSGGHWRNWAQLLSDPHGPQTLERYVLEEIRR